LNPVYENRECQICGNQKNKLLIKQQFSMISESALLDVYNVVVCEDCGFCFADKIPQQSEFDIYYYEMSKYEYQNHGNLVSKYDLARFQTTQSFLGKFLPNHQISILEIGCATGALLSIFKNIGFEM